MLVEDGETPIEIFDISVDGFVGIKDLKLFDSLTLS